MSKTEKLARHMAQQHFNTNRKAQGMPLCRTIPPKVWKSWFNLDQAAETEIEARAIKGPS
jgi:hypothetical protein